MWIVQRGAVRSADPGRRDERLVELSPVPASDLWWCVSDEGYTVVSPTMSEGLVFLAFIVFGAFFMGLAPAQRVREAGGLMQAGASLHADGWAMTFLALALTLLAVRQAVLVLGTQLVDVAAERVVVDIRLGPLCWRRIVPIALVRRADVRPGAVPGEVNGRVRGGKGGLVYVMRTAELELHRGAKITLLRRVHAGGRRASDGLVDRINELVADAKALAR